MIFLKRNIKNFNQRNKNRVKYDDKNYESSRTIDDRELGIIIFNESCYDNKTIKISELLTYSLDPAYKYWFLFDGLEDYHTLMQICSKFHINNISANNILNTTMRPCIESFKGYTSIIFKDIKSEGVDSNIDLEINQISLVLGENFLLTFTENKINGLQKIFSRIQSSNVKNKEINYISYLILDQILENYFEIMETISDKIEDVERNIISNPDKKSIETIHNIKNDLLMLHKIIWSQRESIYVILKDVDLIEREDLRNYFRELYDHLFQINDIIEVFRDRLSSMIDIYLSSTSMKMNETMKVLAIISTVFMPLTFIAGIYGMNFSYMPELQMKYGYPIILLIMAILSIVMIKYFKKNNWF